MKEFSSVVGKPLQWWLHSSEAIAPPSAHQLSVRTKPLFYILYVDIKTPFFIALNAEGPVKRHKYWYQILQLCSWNANATLWSLVTIHHIDQFPVWLRRSNDVYQSQIIFLNVENRSFQNGPKRIRGKCVTLHFLLQISAQIFKFKVCSIKQWYDIKRSWYTSNNWLPKNSCHGSEKR